MDVVKAAQELKTTLVGRKRIHEEQIEAHFSEMLHLPKLDGPPIEQISPLEHLQLARRDGGDRPSLPVVVEAGEHLQVLQGRHDGGEPLQVAHAGQLHAPEGVRADGEVVQPPSVADRERLQGRASPGGDGVAERARAAAADGEPGAAQAELGEPGRRRRRVAW